MDYIDQKYYNFLFHINAVRKEYDGFQKNIKTVQVHST